MDYSIDSLLKVSNEFVQVDDVKSKLSDPRHIDGAIRWRIGTSVLLSEVQWDLVDQLWGYIINGIAALKANGRFESSFPDQPLRLAFQCDGSKIRVIIGEECHVVDADAFYSSVADGGRRFFRRMEALVPEGNATWRYYLNEIGRLLGRE